MRHWRRCGDTMASGCNIAVVCECRTVPVEDSDRWPTEFREGSGASSWLGSGAKTPVLRKLCGQLYIVSDTDLDCIEQIFPEHPT